MLEFGPSIAAWIASTAVPAFAGLLLMTAAGRRLGPGLASGFALGIFLWFFVDTIEGSADLDVSAGFEGGAGQIAMVLLFVAGLLLFFSLDRGMLSESTVNTGILIPLAAAVAVGIHGFGEGTAFGSTAYSTSSSSLLDAFGGLSGGAAYVLHKMLEPMMVGAVYVAVSKDTSRSLAASVKDILILTGGFALPSLLGAITGYFISYDATYFFALGTGTSIFVAFKLARQVLNPTEPHRGHWPLKVSVALAVGFIMIYAAALLHS